MNKEDLKRIEDIRSRISNPNLTGYPWFVKIITFPNQKPNYSLCHADTDGIYTSGTGKECKANVEFIANAPGDIDFLLKIIDFIKIP